MTPRISPRCWRGSCARGGHDVVYAANGKDGAAFLKKVRFDLVVTDIIMPEMDGLELIEIVKKVQPEARILAISGGGKLYTAQACLEAVEKGGADAVLLKPFGPEILMRTLEQMFSVNKPA
jgi:YesN/AraC family two-component response regulator